MKALVDMLHILLCQQPHTYDVMKVEGRIADDGLCYYYLENDIAGGDLMTDHLQWKDISEKFKTSLSLTSDEEALNFIRNVIKISQETKKVADGNVNRLKFIQSLLC